MSANKTVITLFILLVSLSCKSQKLNDNFEFGVFGNIGFLHVGYTRSVVNFNDFSINTGAKIGYVPSTGDEESSTDKKTSSPSILYLNFPAEVLWKFHRSNNVSAGFSYTKILVFPNQYSEPTNSNNYNSVLGEISYGHIVSWNEDNSSTTWVRVYFCPVIYHDPANDIGNIPVRLSFMYNF